MGFQEKNYIPKVMDFQQVEDPAISYQMSRNISHKKKTKTHNY